MYLIIMCILNLVVIRARTSRHAGPVIYYLFEILRFSLDSLHVYTLEPCRFLSKFYFGERVCLASYLLSFRNLRAGRVIHVLNLYLERHDTSRCTCTSIRGRYSCTSRSRGAAVSGYSCMY